MAERKTNPEAVLETMIKRNVRFQFAEYVCALLSAGGAISLAFTQNIMAAVGVAPMVFSIGLNLLNRRELDRLTRQHTFADVIEIKRSLAAEIQSLRSDVEALPAGEGSSTDLQLSLASLSDRIDAIDLQAQNQPVEVSGESLGVIEQDIAQLQHHHIELAQTLEEVKQQFTPAEGEAMTPDLAQEIAMLKDAIAKIEEQAAHPQAAPTDLEPVRAELQAMLTPVQSQVSQLSDKLGVGEFDPNYEPVNAQDIRGQFEGLNTKIDSMQVNVSNEMDVFRGSLENTQGQLQSLHARLEATSEVVEEKMQAALTPIKDHLNGLESKVNELPVVDAKQAPAQAEQLQAVQNQLNDVGSRLDQVSTHVSTELSNLPQLVAEQVKTQVAAMPTPKPAPAGGSAKNADFQALDDLLADLES